MGAITQFMKFGAGIVVAAVALKSLDRLLYSLDETRDERIKAHMMQLQARQEQQRMLAERQASSS